METPTPKAGLGVLGVGTVACAACCAGPILGFLTAAGIASLLGAVVFGAVGLIAVLVVAGILYRRRRRQRACATPPGSTRVEAPTLRAPDDVPR